MNSLRSVKTAAPHPHIGRLPFSILLIYGVVALAVDAARADEIIGTINGKVYHTRSNCPTLKRIVPENRVAFKSIAEAEAQGRRLCKSCERLANQPEKPKPEQGDGNAKGTKPGPKEREPEPSEKKPPGSAQSVRTVHVKKALQGGTLILDDDERVSLVGIGCPQAGQECADEVTKFINERIKSHSVQLVAYSLDDDPTVRDDCGRLLAFIETDEQMPDLASNLISQGLAWVRPDCRNALRSKYLKLETDAWQKNLGIWKRLDGAAGKAEVHVGRYGIHYHPAKCPHIMHLSQATVITLNEAKARRLTPCENYRPPAVPHEASASNTRKPAENAKTSDE